MGAVFLHRKCGRKGSLVQIERTLSSHSTICKGPCSLAFQSNPGPLYCALTAGGMPPKKIVCDRGLLGLFCVWS